MFMSIFKICFCYVASLRTNDWTDTALDHTNKTPRWRNWAQMSTYIYICLCMFLFSLEKSSKYTFSFNKKLSKTKQVINQVIEKT